MGWPTGLSLELITISSYLIPAQQWKTGYCIGGRTAREVFTSELNIQSTPPRKLTRYSTTTSDDKGFPGDSEAHLIESDDHALHKHFPLCLPD
jgi:hypothetical protein